MKPKINNKLAVYNNLCLWYLEGPQRYGRQIYRQTRLQKWIQVVFRGVKRYFWGYSGYSLRIYRSSGPGVYPLAVVIALLIFFNLILFNQGFESPELGVIQLGRAMEIADVDEIEMFDRSAVKRGGEKSLLNSTTRPWSKDLYANIEEPEIGNTMRENMADSRARELDWLGSKSNHYLPVAMSASQSQEKNKSRGDDYLTISWNLTEEQVKERWMEYNRKNLDKPLIGYPLSPKTVSLSNQLQGINQKINSKKQPIANMQAQIKHLSAQRLNYNRAKRNLKKRLTDSLRSERASLNHLYKKRNQLEAKILDEYQNNIIVTRQPSQPVNQSPTLNQSSSRNHKRKPSSHFFRANKKAQMMQKQSKPSSYHPTGLRRPSMPKILDCSGPPGPPQKPSINLNNHFGKHVIQRISNRKSGSSQAKRR